MKPSPVLVTEEPKPWPAMTSCTCSGVTFSSAKRMVQTVPPVKSMANCRPTFPPVNGPMSRKIRPGMVMSSEKAKNQFRLPMTSNTTARLSSDDRGRRSDGPGTPLR